MGNICHIVGDKNWDLLSIIDKCFSTCFEQDPSFAHFAHFPTKNLLIAVYICYVHVSFISSLMIV